MSSQPMLTNDSTKRNGGRLAQRVAVITGAGSGIGQAIAFLFAREGARVVVADINASAGDATVVQIQREGGEALFVSCDVARREQVEALIAGTVKAYGALHILVNNAAYLAIENYGSVTETSEEHWDVCVDVTLKGVYLCAKFAIPHMIAAGGGAIVNIASVGGLVGFGHNAAYCSSKGGVIQLTRELAIDFAADNIRANAVCPGLIATPMNARFRADPEFMNRSLSLPVIKRPGEPLEVAYAALFLASDEASYVTGTTLAVDGGWLAR